LGKAEVEIEKIRDSVNHLLLNSVKFTPDGGTISLSARSEQDVVEVSVVDTGVGIETAALQQLFEPFFTGFDVSRHSSGHYEYGRKGLGLGLSVVKGFVQMHGGTIQASSQMGGGTTITFRLPRVAEPKP
jgi:signal transduction histidine kinase